MTDITTNESCRHVTGADIRLMAIAAVLYLLPLLLGQGAGVGLVFLLLPPALFFWKVTGNDPWDDRGPSRSAAWSCLAYFAVYLALIFKIHLLAASGGLWFSQFLAPALLLRAKGQKLSSTGFDWKGAFRGAGYLLAACLLLTPLIFFVRDSGRLLEMARGAKFYVYLPLSVLFMTATVSFWEEFFFRGVLMSSIRKLSDSAVAAVVISAFLFTIYHFPMRYLNVHSPCYRSAAATIAEIINEHLVMGLFLGFAVHRTKNVWTGIWLHAFMNGLSSVARVSGWIKF